MPDDLDFHELPDEDDESSIHSLDGHYYQGLRDMDSTSFDTTNTDYIRYRVVTSDGDRRWLDVEYD